MKYSTEFKMCIIFNIHKNKKLLQLTWFKQSKQLLDDILFEFQATITQYLWPIVT